MTMRIWKWPLDMFDRQVLQMPQGAKLLDIQMQGDACCIWALCDETAPVIDRQIAVYGTGHPLPDNPGEYIGTFQMHRGGLVYHVFEIR